MQQIAIISEPLDAEQEISSLGLTLPIANKVARAAAVGRASALDVDVAFTPGMLSHIFGNRHLRLQLLPHGWRKGRFNNVESVINDELGIQIIFQNVDLACDINHSPQAISGKGAGSRQLVQAGLQGELWDNPVNPPVDIAETYSKKGVVPLVWMFCVSNDGANLRAELSRPDNFERDQIERFSKRIFLIDEKINEEPDISIRQRSDEENDSEFDFNFNVARK